MSIFWNIFPLVRHGDMMGVPNDGSRLVSNSSVAGSLPTFSQVTVTLTDGRKFLAEVKGSDELSDLAVLKIDKDVGAGDLALPAATLGDSQDLQVIMEVAGCPRKNSPELDVGKYSGVTFSGILFFSTCKETWGNPVAAGVPIGSAVSSIR